VGTRAGCEDVGEALAYRAAYGAACDRLDELDPMRPEDQDELAGHLAGDLLAEAGDRRHEEVIREAIADALAGHRPRW
jgi:hypothetical protein